MSKFSLPESEIISRHRFTRPSIRLWLPVVMVLLLLLCVWVVTPRIGVLDFVAILFLLYVAISAVVTVCEITVVPDGLIIDRLLLPERFVPWNAIDRVIVFGADESAQVEIASIGIYEGLSPLNRLPGLVYGQGLRQTIIITPDAIEDYDLLLQILSKHCPIRRIKMER